MLKKLLNLVEKIKIIKFSRKNKNYKICKKEIVDKNKM